MHPWAAERTQKRLPLDARRRQGQPTSERAGLASSLCTPSSFASSPGMCGEQAGAHRRGWWQHQSCSRMHVVVCLQTRFRVGNAS